MAKKLFLSALLALLVISAWIFGLWLSQSTKPTNLILISLDTLRADRLGAYGYARNTSPNLDALTKSGVVFESTVSTTSWTLPAHVSLFSGLYPSAHGVNKPEGLKIGADTQLLAEKFQAAGYRTAAFTGGAYVGKHFGFDRGFEIYTTKENKRYKGQRGFAASLLRAREYLESLKGQEKFFIFLHTYDIHCPYTPPEPYRSMFKSAAAQEIATNRCGGTFYNQVKPSAEQIAYISDHYDGSIRWVDDQLGVFLNFLKDKQYLKDTLVVVTSDHGEEFFEHGRVGHKETLFREVLMVPLIMLGPGVQPGRSASLVSLVDIAPTLLDIFGLSPFNLQQGFSLKSILYSSEKNPYLRDFQFSELERGKVLRSRIELLKHFILDRESRDEYLFDLEKDIKEQNNLITQEREEANAMRDSIDRFEKEIAGKNQPAKAGEIDQEQMEKLKTLGYLG